MVNDGAVVDPGTMASHIGVAIKQVSDSQNHVGLLYRDSQGVQFCHLAFHHDLRFENARSDYHWAESGVFEDDEESAKILAARIITLKQKRGYISYGFFSGKGPVFNSKGEFIEFPSPGMGLTCATFILELFHAMGFTIVDAGSWPDRAADAAWKDHIVNVLYEYFPDHALALENFRDGVRIRPEEAAACVISQAYPTKYDLAIKMAEEILADLNGVDSSDCEGGASAAKTK
ncbi:hypothetical protein FB593_1011480 [Rhizobium sp. SJZ105]|uniref:hypothetical protein n=1 Tax=Rhizobium sp. SJZ105 TaxID=2572678 RepID=UPI0011A22C29|nr:hypothetical protein [Rhizobium sp. SJZ105]TWC90200.1 hypothetical protein FB593_1011480 [Rhizobium sp. SJZ105]